MSVTTVNELRCTVGREYRYAGRSSWEGILISTAEPCLMDLPQSELTSSYALVELGFQDAEQAQRHLLHLAGNGVTDDNVAPLIPLLLDALRDSPDPDRSLSSFARWFAAVGSPYSHLQTLLHHPVALKMFCLVAGSSQYFADLLTRQPEYFEILANPGVRGGTKTASRFLREVSALVDACQRPELKRDALRRWKAREMLRIGVRDLAGLADMPSTAREFSNLADACVQKALDITVASLPLQQDVEGRVSGVGKGQSIAGQAIEDEATEIEIGRPPTPYPLPPIPFAVIGMGKLGGQELNYSSDIDLMFVQDDDLPLEVTLESGRKMETTAWLTRVAETLIKVLNEDTANGHVFRVDMRLRPEGRFGPLVRSLSSYRAYYENWAEGWERQALIKARFLAGDRSLGDAFMNMVEPFVYRSHVSADFIEEVRANKRRIEQKSALEGETETNLKTGYGGIRDVEFLVQLLQLEFGGSKPVLQTTNTLSALQRLHHAGYLTDQETRELAEDYIFLRTLEHRLQLLHGFQTQTLPATTDDRERLFVARRMGFADREAFETEMAHRRDRLHRHLDRLFYARPQPLTHTLPAAGSGEWDDLGGLLDNMGSPAVQDTLAARLKASDFQDIPAAIRALQLPMQGNEFGGMPPDTPEEFKRVAPRLLSLLSRSPNPDAGLAGIEAVALAVPNRAQLYASLDDSPMVMEKLVQLASTSPPLLNRLTHHLEWMETLFAEESDGEVVNLEPGHPAEQVQMLKELQERLRPLKKQEARLETIARFYLRETLRIGAEDIWEEAGARRTMSELTRLAEYILQTLLDTCAAQIIEAHSDREFAREAVRRVAILGLGKLGGEELGYASDWDVVFVYDKAGRREDSARSQERFALVSALVEQVNAAGKALSTYGANIDIDLRLRPWGRKGALIFSPHSYIDYFRTAGETWERQAALKGRCVAGNCSVGRRFEKILQAVSFGQGITQDEQNAIVAMKRRIEKERLKPGEEETDLKLGHGGLSDIEWLAQWMQLLYGKKRVSLRVPNTIQALSALAAFRLLDNAEATALIETYELLARLRNSLWLLTGQSLDVLANERHRRNLARRFGYRDSQGQRAETQLWNEAHDRMSEARRIFQQHFNDRRGQ